ncbi:MAG: hypothetical protein DMF63_06475 [Acidobacteria bacterium]|nr:MAG: hypothetical protein DMF63_06475 [Acidobacteriota bacterium]
MLLFQVVSYFDTDWTAGIPACHARLPWRAALRLSNQNLLYAVEATALQAGMPAVQSVGDINHFF